MLTYYHPSLDMNQPPPSFLHDIPSIHQKNPAIPAVLANLDLNCGVAAGDALNYKEAIHANTVVTALKSYQGELGLAYLDTLHVCRFWRPSCYT